MPDSLRILYVDDEPGLLEIGKLFLEEGQKLSIETSTSAKKSLERIPSGSFDAIISDYQMPGMDGIQFLQEVRSRFGDIPFILFTGRGREEVVIQALNSGADFYLQKGGDPTAQFAELGHKVRQAVARRAAEKALSESEVRFRDLTENSLDTIMLFGPDLRHLYVNRNVEVQTGIPAAAFIGKTHAELGFPPELTSLWDRTLREVFATGKNQRIEFRIPSGIWIDWLLVPIHAPDGKVVQVITSARDISERKKAEEQIRLAEFSLEHSGITTFWLEEDAHVLRANKAACDALGYTREEFNHLRVFDFDPLYQPGEWKKIWDRIAREKYVVIESIHKRKDGTTFPVEIASTYFEYEGKKIIHSFARDISDRKKAELAIRESEAKYRTLFEKSQDAMLLLDNGEIIDCNAASLAMLGIKHKDHLIHLRPSQLSPEWQPDGSSSQEKAQEMMAIALRDGSNLFEWVHRKVGGEPFWAEVSLTAIPLGGRQILHTMWRDISSRKKAEDDLRSAYERISASEEKLRSQLEETIATQKERDRIEGNFRTLVDNAPDAIFIATPDLRYRYANTAFLRLIGAASFADLERMSTFDRIHPSCHEMVRERIRNLTVDLQPARLQDEIYVKLDGTPVDVEVVAVPVEYYGQHAVLAMIRDITVRKKAETELRAAYEQITAAEEELRGQYDTLAESERRIRESGERFRLLVQNSNDIIQIMDRNGIPFYISDQLLPILGYRPEERIGISSLNDIHPDDVPGVMEALADIIGTPGTTKKVKYRYRHKNGAWVSLEAVGCSRLDDPAVHGIFLNIRDVTGQEQAHDALTESEAYFRAIFDTSLYGIAHTGPDLRFVRVNDTFCSLMEYSREELIGKMEISDVTHPDDRSESREQMQRLIRHEQESFRFEKRYVTRSGRVIHAMVFVVAVFDSEGRYRGASASVMDITERKNAETALRLAEFSIEHTGVATFWFDRNSRIVRVNEASCRALGYSREELLSMRVRDIDPNFPGMDAWDASWNRAKEVREYKIMESVHRRKDGTLFPVEIISSYFTYEDTEYIFSFVHDITECRRANRTIG